MLLGCFMLGFTASSCFSGPADYLTQSSDATSAQTVVTPVVQAPKGRDKTSPCFVQMPSLYPLLKPEDAEPKD